MRCKSARREGRVSLQIGPTRLPPQQFHSGKQMHNCCLCRQQGQHNRRVQGPRNRWQGPRNRCRQGLDQHPSADGFGGHPGQPAGPQLGAVHVLMTQVCRLPLTEDSAESQFGKKPVLC
jgi:hypothetical protein